MIERLDLWSQDFWGSGPQFVEVTMSFKLLAMLLCLGDTFTHEISSENLLLPSPSLFP